MPKNQNQAAAAITGGKEGRTYDLESDLTYRYQQYVLRREALTAKGSTLKHRLFAARAMECASILADSFQKQGRQAEADFWEYRRKVNEAIAFNHKNALAASIGAGDPTGSSNHDSTDQADPDD